MSTYDLGDLFAALTGRSVDPKRIRTRILEHKTYVDLGGPEEDPMTERILELGSPPRVRLDRVNGSYHLTLDTVSWSCRARQPGGLPPASSQTWSATALVRRTDA